MYELLTFIPKTESTKITLKYTVESYLTLQLMMKSISLIISTILTISFLNQFFLGSRINDKLYLLHTCNTKYHASPRLIYTHKYNV